MRPTILNHYDISMYNKENGYIYTKKERELDLGNLDNSYKHADVCHHTDSTSQITSAEIIQVLKQFSNTGSYAILLIIARHNCKEVGRLTGLYEYRCMQKYIHTYYGSTLLLSFIV